MNRIPGLNAKSKSTDRMDRIDRKSIRIKNL